jgi:CRP-like cAMP-binding protein
MSEDLILKNISRHINLNQQEVEFFFSVLQSKTIRKKEFLLRPGEICRYQIFVAKGCLRNYTVDLNGFVHIGMFAVEDWWIGDLHSFLSEIPSTLFIDALEDTNVMMISKPNLELLYERIPRFERFFRILYQSSLITLAQKNMQNISSTAEDRYVNFINKYPQLQQRIPQKQIAAYLGITPEFLSVLRRKLMRS